MVAFVEDWDTYDELATDTSVDWIDAYHPAYKLSPWIGRQPHAPRKPGFYTLNVEVVPGHDPQQLSIDLRAVGTRVINHVFLPGQRMYDVHFFVVEARPGDVVEIAHIEGVRYIQQTGHGRATYDLSGGGKLQNRTLSNDDIAAVPIVSSGDFPLWLTHNLQGQGQLIGVVDSSFDWNNNGSSGCAFGYPDSAIDNYGMALPNLSSVLFSSVGTGGVNLKIPRADLLGGATLQGSATGNEHGAGVAGAAAGDFYGNNDTKWWEHDPDQWDSWAPTNYSGLLGPGIAHEAQLYLTPVDNSSGAFRWEQAGEFPANMSTTLNNMGAAGVATTNHSVGIVESSNTYTQTSVVHDTAGYDNPDMLQCMAAGNDGAVTNALTSQAVVKNSLAVGASDDVLAPEDRVTFSSIGPAFDGRIKPDIMAVGSDTTGRAGGVASLLILPNSNGTSSASCSYQYTAGTSFASPTAAGAGALVHQYFEEGRYGGSQTIIDPSASLIRAALINAGHRLTGANLGNGQYPNSYQGWGEPKLTDVLEFAGSARNLIAYDVDSAGGFASPSSSDQTYDVSVNGSSQRLRVSLVWTDEPGSAGGGKKLINDLHLSVTSPGGSTYLGNVINGSSGESTTGGSADTINTVENVILSSPQTGTWTVTVSSGDGNYASGQGYAVIITGDVSEDTAPPPAPVADFVGSPTSGVAPVSVSFTDQSTGSISNWAWSFGDGGSSSSQSPSHTYTAAGTYSVSLTVTGAGGSDTFTRTNYISVSAPPPPPVANFSGSPTSGVGPLPVSFSDLSSGSISTYAWTFGDGATSSASNPSHTYSAAGTYTVSLTVTGAGGSDIETKTNYISVSEAAPVAEFTGTPTSGDAPLLVNFSDQSLGSVSSWSWNFGDGSTSTAQSPSHTYTATGTFTVSLTVSGPGGSDGETKVSYIAVSSPPPPPTAALSGTPTSGTAPLVVSFSDNSTGSVTSWNWAFGDGGTSTAQNPSYTYTSPGTYSVSLTVAGPGGNDSTTEVGYVSVSAAPPIAEFVGTPTSGNVPLNVNFTDQSSGTVTNWNWDFGDGGSSTGQSPSHTYTAAGTYTVVLTATGPGGSDSRTRVNYITASDPPVGGPKLYFSFTSGTSVPGVGTVQDEDVVSYDPQTGIWAWVFDGSDVGVTADLNAISVLGDGSIVMSFQSGISVPGLTGGPSGTSIDDSDLVRFIPTSTGSSTSGSFEFYFDGSDVGLSSNGEDIDSVCVLDDGTIIISTVGTMKTGGTTWRDEDAALFTPTSIGSNTSGSWQQIFDGSDMGLSASSSGDISALTLDFDSTLLFSTIGSITASGLSFVDEDVNRFTGTYGSATSGTFSAAFDLSALGISTGEDVDGVSIR